MMLKSIIVFILVFFGGYFLWLIGRTTLLKNEPLKKAFSKRSYWENEISGLEEEIEVVKELMEVETLDMKDLNVEYKNAKGEEKIRIKSKIDSLENLLNHYRDNLRKLELELRKARDELLKL